MIDLGLLCLAVVMLWLIMVDFCRCFEHDCRLPMSCYCCLDCGIVLILSSCCG